MNQQSEINNRLLADDQMAFGGAEHQNLGLNRQLFRYAEDLQQMIERNDQLTTSYQRLMDSSNELIKSRETLNDLIQNLSDLHLVTDLNGIIIQANRAAEVIAIKKEILKSNLKDWVLPAYQDKYELAINCVRQMLPGSSTGLGTELHLRCKNNPSGVLIVCIQFLAIHLEDSSLLHWVIRDVTAMREREFENHISSLIVNNATEGVMITDEKSIIKLVNPAFTRINGYTAEDAIGRNPKFLQSGMHDQQFYLDLWKSLKESDQWHGVIYNRTKHGRIFAQWLVIKAVKNHQGQTANYIGIFSELLSAKKSDNELTYLAYYDSLTGLPNRQLLQDRMNHLLSQNHEFTVIFIDLDSFKQINDFHGHHIGDQVLKEAARRMKDSLREIDMVARQGGDEFILLCPGLHKEDAIARVCNKVIQNIKQPMRIEDKNYQIGASLGCTIYPNHGDDESQLIKHADLAMYEAKKTGGNTFVIFDSSFCKTYKPLLSD